MPPQRSSRVCLVSAEVAPFAKTGGLADVSAALARYLHKAGQDVRVVMPMYGRIREAGHVATPVPLLQDLPLELGGRTRHFSVSTLKLPRSEATVYAVRCPELYERPGIYTQDEDEHVRFAFLSQAALRICQQLGWAPDVVHCNDWHTGLLPLYLETHFGWDELFAATKTVMTIHNIGYQGVVGADAIGSLGLEGQRSLLHQEHLEEGHVNLLETALLYCNAITTVSETYAQEIQGAELGMGLEDILRERANVLVGIVNGVDYGEWSPDVDEHLPANFDAKDLSGKAVCRSHLLQRMGLEEEEGAMTIGIVSRLTAQKGFELLPSVLPRLFEEENVRLCVLGRGEERIEAFFDGLVQRYPGRVAYDRGYKEDLSHQIEAGVDLFLMPSRFEPCGLNQMYSLKYGTVPLVRRTGGLADTVSAWDPETREGTGFLFGEFSAQALAATLRFALHCWSDRSGWSALMQNGMSRDFSWDKQTGRYIELYRRLTSA